MCCPREEVGNKAAVFRTPWVLRARAFRPLHLGVCERRKRKGSEESHWVWKAHDKQLRYFFNLIIILMK